MVIFGLKPYNTLRALVALQCSRCHQHAPHRLWRKVNKFALFFIPLFVVSRSYTVECGSCAQVRKVSRSDAQTLRDQARAQDDVAAQKRAQVTGYRVISSEPGDPQNLH